MAELDFVFALGDKSPWRIWGNCVYLTSTIVQFDPTGDGVAIPDNTRMAFSIVRAIPDPNSSGRYANRTRA
jgi:hypothetical protein